MLSQIATFYISLELFNANPSPNSKQSDDVIKKINSSLSIRWSILQDYCRNIFRVSNLIIKYYYELDIKA